MRLVILFTILAVGAAFFLGYTLGRLTERRSLKFKLIDHSRTDPRIKDHLNRWLDEL